MLKLVLLPLTLMMICGCASEGAHTSKTSIAPSLATFHTESLPVTTPTMEFVQQTLVPFFAIERTQPLSSDGRYPLELLGRLTPQCRSPFDELERYLRSNGSRDLRSYIIHLEPFQIRYSQDVTAIFKIDENRYLKIPAGQRAMIVRLVSFDKRRGIILESGDYPIKMYFSQLNRNNLRYYTISSSGVFADKSYSQICDDLALAERRAELSDLLLNFAQATKGGLGASSIRSLAVGEQLILFDLLGISMSEEFRRINEVKRLAAKKPHRTVDPFNPLKMALLMLSDSHSPRALCQSYATNFIGTSTALKALQVERSAELRRADPAMYHSLPASFGIMEGDIFEAIANYLRTPGQITEQEYEGLERLISALDSFGRKPR